MIKRTMCRGFDPSLIKRRSLRGSFAICNNCFSGKNGTDTLKMSKLYQWGRGKYDL
jgi:hypothetical protein